MTVTVSLIPLVPIRRISPLTSLRATVEPGGERDYLQWAIAVLVLIGFSIALATVMGTWIRAGSFVVGVVAVLLVLSILSRSLTRVAKAMSRFRFSTSWKYAVANLYRPGNQTRVMMMTIGLCVLMIGLIGLLDRGLVEQIAMSDEGRQPNMVLFDIQTDQVDTVGHRISGMGFPVLQRVPIVTMRLTAVRGRSLDDIRRDSTSDLPRWVGEFRSTYRDSLIETETLVAGQLRKPSDSVWISMEEGIARQLDVSVGDRLDFDIQGVPMATYVGSLREVNWRRVQPNFYIVFPTSVLESAPQFYAMVTHVPSAEMSALLQRTLVQSFPNISMIDLRLILQTVEKVLQQLKWVIQFMSLFTVAVAVVILGSAIWTARFGRIKDSVLLRTIGAQRAMIVRMTAGEFLIMTVSASIAGSLLAHAASAFILNLIFDTASVNGWDWTTGTVLATVVIVVSVGLGLNRGILTQAPLDVIRSEY
jgi:putative ABC transport system permease protein